MLLEKIPDPSGEGFYYRMPRKTVPIAELPTENVWHNPNLEGVTREVVQIKHSPWCNYRPKGDDGASLNISVITNQCLHAMVRRDSGVSISTRDLLLSLAKDKPFVAQYKTNPLRFSDETSGHNEDDDLKLIARATLIPSVNGEGAE
jgi:hypothetical protein